MKPIAELLSLSAASMALHLSLPTSTSGAQSYVQIASRDDVYVSWRDARIPDGSGGAYFEQLLRFENHNDYPVAFRFRARVTCRDGSIRDSWSGGDRLLAGQSKSGELAGLWSRSCDGGASTVELVELSVQRDGSERPGNVGGFY